VLIVGVQLPSDLALAPQLDVDAFVQRQADQVQGFANGHIIVRHDDQVSLSARRCARPTLDSPAEKGEIGPETFQRKAPG
jgi:hypothetical protein